MMPGPMAHPVQQVFRRYADLVASVMAKAPAGEFVPGAEGDGAVQVERGAVYAAALGGAPEPGGASGRRRGRPHRS